MEWWRIEKGNEMVGNWKKKEMRINGGLAKGRCEGGELKKREKRINGGLEKGK